MVRDRMQSPVRRRGPSGARALPWVATFLVLHHLPASGQTVLVHAVNAETSAPIVGAMVHLTDSGRRIANSTLTDERGRGLFVGLAEGTYRLRVEMIGMETIETAPFDLEGGETITRRMRLAPQAVALEGLEVAADGRCSIRPAEGRTVARVWDEARKALEAASLTAERGRYRYETMRYERRIDRDSEIVLDEETTHREGFMETPYESRPAEDLVANGFVQPAGDDDLYFAPDAAVLLSDAFLDTHCLHLTGREDRADLIGLGFRPTGRTRNVPDIAGTMWIDATTAELRSLEYTYQYLEPERASSKVGGRVDFQRMPDGTWIVREWWIRMPVMSTQTGLQGDRLTYIEHYKQEGGVVVEARDAGGRRLERRTTTGGIEGVVRDSLGAPLAGARVGLVGSNQEVFTDADGAFGITRLPEGRYRVRVVGTGLEVAGYGHEPVVQDVIAGEMAYLDIHLPSLSDVLFDGCRNEPREEDTGVLAGTVIDARGRPVRGATVRVEWNVYDFRGVTTGREVRDLTEVPHGFEASTDVEGTYRFCSVPTDTRLFLEASTAELVSAPVEISIGELEVGTVRVLELSEPR